jgi:hypothetical protein
LAEALMRRYLKQDGLLFKGLFDEASELIDQQYSMATLVSPDKLAFMFIAVIGGGILLARNLDQNQLLGSQLPGFAYLCADALRRSPGRFLAIGDGVVPRNNMIYIKG